MKKNYSKGKPPLFVGKFIDPNHTQSAIHSSLNFNDHEQKNKGKINKKLILDQNYSNAKNSSEYSRQSSITSMSKKKFNKIFRAISVICKLQKTQTEQINNESEYEDQMMKSSYNSPQKQNFFQENYQSEQLSSCKAQLTYFKKKAMLFKAAERGSNEDIELIKYLLKKDPKQNFFNNDDPNKLINQKDKYGRTILYIACENGYLSLVKELFNLEVVPQLSERIQNNGKEDILTVAAKFDKIFILKQFVLKMGTYQYCQIFNFLSQMRQLSL